MNDNTLTKLPTAIAATLMGFWAGELSIILML
jgi:hypothetical protein